MPDDRTDMLDWLSVTVLESGGTDYPVRLFIDKDAWADAAHDLVTEIDNDNFKSEVGKAMDDPAYLSALHQVWDIGRRLSR